MTKVHGLTGKPLLYFTTVFVSLGVFLFGYDQGVMSGIITSPYFLDYFNQPSRAEIGTMVAILEVGALISSLVVGRVGDIIGRRKSIFWGSLVFVIGGAIQSFTTGLASMIVGRFISGIGVGFLSTIVPVYQSEISPPHNRGKLACIEFTGNIVGYSSSVWVDYAASFIESDVSWRLPLFIQCIMGSLLLLGSLVIVETPRWLLDHDHDDAGLRVIADLHGGGDVHHPRARQEFREIKDSVLLARLEGERSYTQMWRRYKKRVLIAMSSQMFAQLNGINVISYYAPLVFEQAGWVGRQAILMTGINSLVYILSTIPPWYVSDRWGRRFILMSGALVMAVALSLISYFMYLSLSYTPQAVVILVIIYNAFFGYSWGPIPWLYPPEILPLNVRAKGASLSTASNWAFNFIVGEATPVLQEVITWRLYLIHAFSCVCSFICVYFMYPETMGVNLEDMGSLFGDKSVYSSAASISSSINSGINGYHHLPSADHQQPSTDTTTLLGTQAGASPSLGPALSRTDSPVLQPSAAALARAGDPRSRSNSAGYYSPLGPGAGTAQPPFSGINPSDVAQALGGGSAVVDNEEEEDERQGEEDDDEESRQGEENQDNSKSQNKPASVAGVFGRLFKKQGGTPDLEASGASSSNKPLLSSHQD
ncbi:uncharacterized protein SAPINGB_P001991 [Magnusiomyces paraingens]|uniref:Major facilitator superfamily (MFS) profile domain-containing protein n=1 Tax=Magnusiomyces paraingens TaxID=2606893 RepID=A0A5E8BH87_9ASCO|nr:uncharacterized protein SAPINGB_P001991 [Saprochaete ingens]VVT48871.1 unnamed protein product [Saprochaete ingens]